MRTVTLMALATLLSACAVGTEQQVAEPRLKRPPVARQQKPVRTVPPAVPDPAAAPAKADPEAAGQEAPVPVTAEPTEVYRVKTDGTVGCEDPSALRILRGLREAGGAGPRLLAQAHRDGRCMTVYRVNEWALESEQGDMARLRLMGASGRAVSLYFLREEIGS